MSTVMSTTVLALSALATAPFALVLLTKATLLLGVGIIAALISRSTSPAMRHCTWTMALSGALILPVVMVATPAWRVRILPPSGVPGGSTMDVLSRGYNHGPVTALSAQSRTQHRRVDVGVARLSAHAASASELSGQSPMSIRSIVAARPAWPFILWLLGSLVGLVWIAVGRFGLRQLQFGARPLDTQDWRATLDMERARAGVTRPVCLLSTAAVSTPLTWGIRSPVILLPESAKDWPQEHLLVVLRHELAHIARCDSLTQLVATAACAMYWFHPLVWFAARRQRAECERACDERVLSYGTSTAEYAAHLLDVARSARALGAQGLVSVAMARPSQLEGRLLAVLNEHGRRAGMSAGMSHRARSVGVGASLAVILAVSAFRPVPRLHVGGGTLSGGATVQDSLIQRAVSAHDGGTLVLDLGTGGSVDITGSDEQRASVTASLGGRNWRETDMRFEQTDAGARLVSRYTGTASSQSFNHTFRIRVPRHFNVSIASAGGNISIHGVDGTFTGHTGGGEIHMDRTNGHAHISTGGGSLQVMDSHLTGSVSTGGGSVSIQGVTGGLVGHSGSGDVTYSNSDIAQPHESDSMRVSVSAGGAVTEPAGRPIQINKDGGDVHVTAAPNGAHVTTGGGEIRIGQSAGDVYAYTGGGDIQLGPINGSAEANTGSGDVTVTLTGNGAHSINATSGTGRVVLVLPPGLSATLDLETAYTNNFGRRTRIESDWPLQVTETDQWDTTHGTPRRYVRARESIGGGGGLIRVRTVNGDIVVQRGSAR